jgi:hypothetical protein
VHCEKSPPLNKVVHFQNCTQIQGLGLEKEFLQIAVK